MKSLLPFSPDLILSGINIGSNLGNNIIYSGTVAAAIEGATLDIPSNAIKILMIYIHYQNRILVASE